MQNREQPCSAQAGCSFGRQAELTRGHLIGHRIRVCSSLSSMELQSFVPPAPPQQNEGDAARPSFSSARLSERSCTQVDGKAAFSAQALQLQARCCACP